MIAVVWLQFIRDCNHGVLEQTGVIVGGHYLDIILSKWFLKTVTLGF